MAVSLWHFCRRGKPDVSFSDLFEAVCQGTSVSGPFWDHVLGYWNTSKATPEAAEEEAGVVAQIVTLCSLDNLKNLEVNKPSSASRPLANDWFFRKGEAGNWVNLAVSTPLSRRSSAAQDSRSRDDD